MRNAALRLPFILGVLWTALIAHGQTTGYPKSTDPYVNDFADVVKGPDAKAIRDMFKRLDYQTGVQAVIVTIQSIADYRTGDESVDAFANHLADTWGVGDKKKNNGMLILVSVKDRKCRIALGGAYGALYDNAMKQVIKEKMVPYFKENDYSRGIYEGARGAIEVITTKISWFSFFKWHIAIAVLIVICVFAGFSCLRSGRSGWGWAFFIAAGALLFFLLKMLLSGKSSHRDSSGFGGGGGFGGGASGSW